SSDAGALRGPAPSRVSRPAPGQALRAHDPAGACAGDPRGAPTREQVRLARELPHGSARGRSADDAREDRDAGYDDEVDRGDGDNDSASREAPATYLVKDAICKKQIAFGSQHHSAGSRPGEPAE